MATVNNTTTAGATDTKKTQDYLNQRSTETQAGINSAYDSNIAAQRQALENAYNANTATQAEQQQNIQKNYDTAAYDVGVQNARNAANTTQFADVRGVNSGIGSQHQLSLGNAQARAQTAIENQKNLALAENQRQQDLAKTNYQNLMTQALADNDYKRAAALLDDYNNNKKWQDQQAEILASFGNFDPYGEMYGTDAANTMKNVWMAQNPEVAYRTGAIDAETYKNITGSYPKGYTPPLFFDTSWYTGYVPGKTKGGNNNKGAITPDDNKGSTPTGLRIGNPAIIGNIGNSRGYTNPATRTGNITVTTKRR